MSQDGDIRPRLMMTTPTLRRGKQNSAYEICYNYKNNSLKGVIFLIIKVLIY